MWHDHVYSAVLCAYEGAFDNKTNVVILIKTHGAFVQEVVTKGEFELCIPT
jgi:hypothetical protein